MHLGIETTTGPLGQGFANAVGMALAERSLAATFNRPGHTIIDHHTYVFVGDGCMMEGISHEAASFAGMQKLGKLIAVYDDNGISIDGKVRGLVRRQHRRSASRPTAGTSCRTSTARDSEAVAAALAAARAVTDRPSLICAKTVIGWGAPNKQGTAVHARRGAWAMRKSPPRAGRWAGPRRRSRYPPIFAPPGTGARRVPRPSRSGARRFAAYQSEFPALAAEFERRMAGDLPGGFDDLVRRLHRQRASRGQVARHAPVLAGDAERHRARRCPNCSAARRI